VLLKYSIVKVKAGFLCLAQVLIIAMARVNGEPKCKSYGNGYSMKQPVQVLLSASGFDLTNGGVLRNLNCFVIIFRTAKL